ncbi:MAG: hypothetical protein GEV12_06810 [Micromonosporaceae bacterium]|nr:hypothetical protein [Micromonosporaceae bacterium]
MSVLGIAAQFAAVFIAAFLAFGLEDLRERRRAARWVRTHLRHLRELMRSDGTATGAAATAIAGYLAALDSWLAAEKPADMAESDWKQLAETFSTVVPDFGPVLRSEAVTVLPQDLARALVRLEAGSQQFAVLTSTFQRANQDVLAAWHERRVPLSDPDASRVRRLHQIMSEMRDAEQRFSPIVGEVVTALDNWS